MLLGKFIQRVGARRRVVVDYSDGEFTFTARDESKAEPELAGVASYRPLPQQTRRPPH